MPAYLQDGFVTVYRPDGTAESVPEHYLDNPALLGDRSATAPADAGPVGEPNDSWKVADLEDFARRHNVDVDGLGARPTKTQLVDAIHAAAADHQTLPDPTGTGSTSTPIDANEPPATGGEE